MDNLYQKILRADCGDVEAQVSVANHIIWEEKEPIEPDWAERALHYYKCAAEQGNSDALVAMGMMYRLGKGVDCDIGKSFSLLKEAAATLNPKAYRYLGYAQDIPVSYLDENDEAIDYKPAFDWFFKGAMLGDPNCMYKIGDMFFSGKYVNTDRLFASCLYSQSCEEIGCFSAAINLRIGECYLSGIGVKKDIDEAIDCFEYAVTNYEYYIKDEVAPELYLKGYNRAKSMLMKIKSENYEDAAFDIAEEPKDDSGYIEFINSDAMVYPEPETHIEEIERMKTDNPIIKKCSDGTDIRFADALDAAEKGDTEAMYSIALHCFSYMGDITNNKSLIDFSLYYYHKAIRNGHRRAMYNLAAIYSFGENGIPINSEKAFKLYLYSDVIDALGEIGVFYAKGEVVDKDYAKAYKYFANCAIRCKLFDMPGGYGSLMNLSKMYRKGIYVEKDERFAEFCEILGEEMKAKWDAVVKETTM